MSSAASIGDNCKINAFYELDPIVKPHDQMSLML